jgi:hypothetical protein
MLDLFFELNLHHYIFNSNVICNLVNYNDSKYLRCIFDLSDCNCSNLDKSESASMNIDNEDPSLALDINITTTTTNSITTMTMDWCLDPVYLIPNAYMNFSNANGDALSLASIQAIIQIYKDSEESQEIKPFGFGQDEHPICNSKPCFTLHICELQARLELLLETAESSRIRVEDVVENIENIDVEMSNNNNCRRCDLLCFLNTICLVGQQLGMYNIQSANFVRAQQSINQWNHP